MYEYNCTVTRVVDGDTIDVILDLGFSILHKCRVRLYGIDTPESRTRDKDEKARGKLAAKYVETLQRSNEQLVKLAALVQKNEKKEESFSLSGTDKDDIYDMIRKDDEERD